MCGRASVSKKQADLEKRFNAKFNSKDTEQEGLFPKYNMGPTQFLPILTNSDEQHFHFYHWGLVFQARDGKIFPNLIVAKKENLLKIPLFNECLDERRCILPVTSYFEWKEIDRKRKIPYLVKLNSNEIFSLGGLWMKQKNEKGEMIDKFLLIIQEPTSGLSFIHDRMPAIFTPEKEKIWLDKNVGAKEAIQLINQHPDEDIHFHPVSNELNRSYDNDPKFLVEKRYDIEEQGSLF